MPNQSLKNKKIAMIIAFQDFRDEEYFIPKSIFLTEGAQVITVSSKKGKAIGSYGGVIDVQATFDDLNIDETDALVFVGGSGAGKYIDDEACHQLANNIIDKEKVLGAICIAPAILARSGVLKGKKATVWSSQMDKSAVKILKEEGASYQTDAVIRDGNIVTANGPLAARRFAESIVKVLT